VILLTNLDSSSSAAIIGASKSQGVTMIDYDRLTLKANADYYVSGDATEACRLQGQDLIDGLEEGASTSRRSPSCTERRPTRSRFSAKELYGALFPPSARCWDGRI
jgi:ABC-type xylose transport system substrate-binding protein